MAALAKKQGVRTAIGLQARLSPTLQKAKEIIDSGALGRILTTNLVMYSSMFMTLSEEMTYLDDPKSGASIVSIPAMHALDPLIYLLGEFRSLTATTGNAFPAMTIVKNDNTSTAPTERKTPDSVTINGILKSGTIVNFAFLSTTNATPAQFSWLIAGEKGSLKFEGPSPFISMVAPTLSKFEEGGMWEEVEMGSGLGFGSIGEVYQAFANGGKGVVDFEEAVVRHKLVEALQRSAEKGTRESY